MNQTTPNELFEAHITIDSDGPTTESRFKEFCTDLEVKVIQIELPEQEHEPQLMTGSFHKGGYEDVLERVYGLAEIFSENGFHVTRRKIETIIKAREANFYAPMTAYEAQLEPSRYFEFHIKATNPDEKLEGICLEHGAHLSRSISSRVQDKPQKFITQRDYTNGYPEAHAKFVALERTLREEGYPVSNRLREYCMLDDNKAVDGGWGEPK